MSKGNVIMNEQDRLRMLVMEKVQTGEMSLGEAGEAMNMSRRRAKRVWARYREDGAAGLTHKLRGRDGNRAAGPEVRTRALELVRKHYGDYGPTLAAEKLAAKHDLKVDHETLRRWMKAAGLWAPARERRKHRRRRKRRECLGELVQIDGSHHPWFEERGETCCLMVMIDDATNRRLALQSAQETTEAALTILRMWIEKWGVPRTLYRDRKTVYLNEAGPDGKRPPTVFGKACEKLGIGIIPAKSPQAKGRVENANKYFQDRWVKEMRELGLSGIGPANAALPAFLDKVNADLEIQPANPKDAHRPADPYDLGAILAREDERVVSNDAVVRHESRWFQLDANAVPGSRAVVRSRLDGRFQIFSGGRELAWTEIPEPPPKAPLPLRPRPARLTSPRPIILGGEASRPVLRPNRPFPNPLRTQARRLRPRTPGVFRLWNPPDDIFSLVPHPHRSAGASKEWNAARTFRPSSSVGHAVSALGSVSTGALSSGRLNPLYSETGFGSLFTEGTFLSSP